MLSERSLKAELAEELDVREKRLQESTVEIQALTSLKAGLEGSLQTSNARALDDKAKYEQEMSLRREEVDKFCTKVQELEKELKEKIAGIHALEQERDQVRDAYEQMLAAVRNELGRFITKNLDYFSLKKNVLGCLVVFVVVVVVAVVASLHTLRSRFSIFSHTIL